MTELTMTATVPAELEPVRRRLRGHLQRCRCENDDVLLVFSELVSNAVRHAGGATTIKVVHRDETVRVEVYDRATSSPTLRDTDVLSPGGRGLHIVRNASRDWGWEHTSTGKRVWALVSCSQQP